MSVKVTSLGAGRERLGVDMKLEPCPFDELSRGVVAQMSEWKLVVSTDASRCLWLLKQKVNSTSPLNPAEQ